MAESELFEKGLTLRRELLGDQNVEASLAGADDFMMAFQRVVTEWVWGYAWSDAGLDHRTRSILNLGILTALGRFDELGIYVKARSTVTSPLPRYETLSFMPPSIAALLPATKPSCRRTKR